MSVLIVISMLLQPVVIGSARLRKNVLNEKGASSSNITTKGEYKVSSINKRWNTRVKLSIKGGIQGLGKLEAPVAAPPCEIQFPSKYLSMHSVKQIAFAYAPTLCLGLGIAKSIVSIITNQSHQSTPFNCSASTASHPSSPVNRFSIEFPQKFGHTALFLLTLFDQ